MPRKKQRKTNLLDVGYDKISDSVTRHSIQRVWYHVSRMLGYGIETTGKVLADRFQIGDQPSLKYMVRAGTLPADASLREFIVPGKVLGVFGVTTRNSSSQFFTVGSDEYARYATGKQSNTTIGATDTDVVWTTTAAQPGAWVSSKTIALSRPMFVYARITFASGAWAANDYAKLKIDDGVVTWHQTVHPPQVGTSEVTVQVAGPLTVSSSTSFTVQAQVSRAAGNLALNNVANCNYVYYFPVFHPKGIVWYTSSSTSGDDFVTIINPGSTVERYRIVVVYTESGLENQFD